MTVYNERLSQYIQHVFVHQDEALARVFTETPAKGLPAISIKPEEGAFLQLLVRASGGQRALEIGTLGGYSSIWLARGLAPGGRLITLEVEPKHAEVARQHFAAAGIADRVEVRVGPALRSLDALSSEPAFDFIFIDADKPSYPAYLDWAIEHVRPNGIITAHNAFRRGSVAGLDQPDENTQLMDAFNRQVGADPRLLSTIYPAGDGTVVMVKIG